MNRIVLDASITMAWCFVDEQNEFADEVIKRLASGQTAVVPSLWAVEVANAVLIGERRKRANEAEVARFFALIDSLPIDVDRWAMSRAFTTTLQIARSYSLTAYDATYLELAKREDLVLATLDERLRAAALQAKVTLFH